MPKKIQDVQIKNGWIRSRNAGPVVFLINAGARNIISIQATFITRYERDTVFCTPLFTCFPTGLALLDTVKPLTCHHIYFFPDVQPVPQCQAYMLKLPIFKLIIFVYLSVLH